MLLLTPNLPGKSAIAAHEDARGCPPSVVSSSSVHPPERPLPHTAYDGCVPEPGPLRRFIPDSMSPEPLARTFRHSGWQHMRIRVYRALHATDQSIGRCNSFSECGHGAYVLRSLDNPNKYRLAGSTCHDRFCQPCASERSRTIATNVAARLGNDGCRFLTLTVREGADGLRPAIAHLYASFRRLQRKGLWKARVTGGVAFLEIKWNEPSQRWHPHLHCLLHGRYIPQRELSELWRAITGGSYVVDIRPCKGVQAITRYVCKYASKPLNMSYGTDFDRLCEALVATKGKRMCVTFGGWKSVLLTDHADEDGWEQIESLESMIARASGGDAEARSILHSLDDKATEIVLVLADKQKPRPPPIPDERKPKPQQQFDFPPRDLLR